MADVDNSNALSTAQEDPEKLFERLMAETEGLLPRGFAKRIERDLLGAGHLGVSRRVALVILEKPFRTVAKKAETERDFAVAMAHVSEVLTKHIQSYQTLVDWLRASQVRMLMATCAREDSGAIFEEAKKCAEAPNIFGRFMRMMRG